MIYRKQVGLSCLILGGLAWPLGFAADYEIPQILPVHLSLIFFGLVLRGSHLLEVIKRKRHQQKDTGTPR